MESSTRKDANFSNRTTDFVSAESIITMIHYSLPLNLY